MLQPGIIRIAGSVMTAAALLMAIPAAPAAAQTSIRFTLDTKFEGPTAPFLVAADRGYFKAQGLDVTIDPSNGASEPFTRLASGAYDMASGDINSMIRFRDANPAAPIKAVFMLYNKPAYSIVGRKSRGVVAPKDLEGRKLGAPAADSSFAQWKIFVHATGIDPAKVIIENIGMPVREPMLAAGQVDAITGLSFTSFVNLKDRGVPVEDITVMLMANYGVELYGHAIMVNSKFAAENPDAVRKFLSAFLKGLRETVRNPDAATAIVLKHNDAAKKDVELDRLKMVLRDNILTPEVKANGLGGIDPERLDRSVAQLALAHEFKAAKPKAADIFDSSFLPPAAERKAP